MPKIEDPYSLHMLSERGVVLQPRIRYVDPLDVRQYPITPDEAMTEIEIEMRDKLLEFYGNMTSSEMGWYLSGQNTEETEWVEI